MHLCERSWELKMPVSASINGLQIPDLTFPMLHYGVHQVPWNLLPYLYSGGASTGRKKALDAIQQGSLGACIVERLPLIERIHRELSDEIAAGKGRFTVRSRIIVLGIFFAWADRVAADLRLETLQQNYCIWTDELLHRQLILREISGKTTHSYASTLSALFTSVLGRELPLIKDVKVRRKKGSGKFGTSAADKINLTKTFEFGRALIDTCECLSYEAIKGRLPVKVSLNTGQTLEFWSGVHKPVASFQKTTLSRPSEVRKLEQSRAVRQADNSLKARAPLVNLRIEAELLLFIAQTGMNLQQAYMLDVDTFHYSSYLDGYQVRRYKARRNGVVLFEIFNEYRIHFEKYLTWRNTWFPEQSKGLLFPLITNGRSHLTAPTFWQIENLCKKSGIECFRPRTLRNTRVNWLLRRMGDPQQVADMAQHDLQTLLRKYEEPNPQLAMIEISKFHAENALNVVPPAPGSCEIAMPEPLDGIPDGAPIPDCVISGGCLFCKNHRDIDSYDHIWSLLSFRHLKSIELARYVPPNSVKPPLHPAHAVVHRITQKIIFFENSSEIRRMWVKESLLRIEEEYYHPSWDGFIQLNEIRESLE